MALSEAEAYAILQAHCTALHGRLVFLPREHTGSQSVRKRMAVECHQLTDEQIDGGLGVQLRLALDIVNAICSIPGLEPHVNLPFWRHVVCSLWVAYPLEPLDRSGLLNERELFTPEPCEFLPFDKTAFSEYAICVVNIETSGLTPRVCSLWRQLAGVPLDSEGYNTSEASRALVRVRRLVASQRVRSMSLSLRLPYSTLITVSPKPTFVTSADIPLYVSTIEAMGANLASRGDTIILVEWSLDLSAESGLWKLVPWLRGLASAHALVSASSVLLDYEATTRESSVVATSRYSGELLKTAVLQGKALRHLKVRWEDDVRVTGEAFSLTPTSASSGLSRLTLRKPCEERDSEFWYWLAFALLHPETECSPLTIEVYSACRDPSALDSILTNRLPLRPVAERLLALAAITDYHLQWFRPGDAVALVLTSDASAFYDPPCTRDAQLPTLTQGARLDAVVVVPSRELVGVVIPAYGLCWVAADDVAIERASEEQSSTRVDTNGIQALRDLHLIVRTAVGVDAAIECALVYGLIVSLSLFGTFESITAVTLRSLLRCCPNLRRLAIKECRLESFYPLVAAYSDRVHPCRISDLDLLIGRLYTSRGIVVDWVPLTEMLADPTHPSTRVLTQLSLTRLWWTTMVEVAQALRVNQSLVQVSVTSVGDFPASYASARAAMAALFDPFEGQVLLDGRKPRMGLLNVVRYAHKSGAESRSLGVLNRFETAVLTVVFEFVGRTVKRHVSWRHRRPAAYGGYDE